MENHELIFKWLKSENASSDETKRLARKTRDFLQMSSKEYRKMLSYGREKTKVLERIMSLNEWDKIDFSKVPSRAGLIYKNAFAQKEVIAARYAAFIEDKNTKIHSDVLYPYEIVAKATKISHYSSYYGRRNGKMANLLERETLEKMWNALPNYFADKPEDKMLCVVDTSGSMTGVEASVPINVAISLGMYAAERARGPFKDHYISFSRKPQLIHIEGVDFVDKVRRIYETNLCENTDLEAVFKMLLKIANNPSVKEEDIPNHIVIISDMEIDSATAATAANHYHGVKKEYVPTLMEQIGREWVSYGHKAPKLTYWNVDARNNTVLDLSPNVSYVSGMSPSIFKQVTTGKTGMELCLETLNSDRYKNIKI